MNSVENSPPLINIEIKKEQLLEVLENHGSKNSEMNSRKIHKFCRICEQNFVDQKCFFAHLATHFLTTNVKYSCERCKLIFGYGEQYRRHFALFHTEVLYRCGACLKLFSKQHLYEEHVGAHLLSAHSYDCAACLQSFMDYDSFVAHVIVAHNANDVEMPDQNEAHRRQNRDTDPVDNPHDQLPTSLLYSSHLALNTVENYESVLKQFIFNGLSAIPSLKHNSSDYEKLANPNTVVQPASADETTVNESARVQSACLTKGLKCSVCDEQCRDELSLDWHRLRAHCKVPRGDRCAHCRRALPNVDAFIAHARTHAENPRATISCIVCRQSIRGDAQILMHARYHLTGDDSLKQREEEATRHENASLNSSDYEASAFFVCEKCGEKLAVSAQLDAHNCKAHRARNTLVPRAENPAANTATPDRVTMKPGVLGVDILEESPINNDAQRAEQPTFTVRCAVCPKTFASMSALRGHSHVHKGYAIGTNQRRVESREFECARCALRFNSATRLAAHHRRYHRQTRQFRCRICDETFQSEELQKMHSKMHNIRISAFSATVVE